MADQQGGLMLCAKRQMGAGIEQQTQQFGITGKPLGAHQFHAALQVFDNAQTLVFRSLGLEGGTAVVQP